MSGVRVNGLDLVRQLSGRMCITGTGKVVVKAKGQSTSPTASVVASAKLHDAEVGAS